MQYTDCTSDHTNVSIASCADSSCAAASCSPTEFVTSGMCVSDLGLPGTFACIKDEPKVWRMHPNLSVSLLISRLLKVANSVISTCISDLHLTRRATEPNRRPHVPHWQLVRFICGHH